MIKDNCTPTMSAKTPCTNGTIAPPTMAKQSMPAP